MPLNVEIKARCDDPDRIREILKSQDAFFKGTDHQIDTYFPVQKGRLKLREGIIENALIFYEREEISGPKKSQVELFPLAKSSSLKNILINALGILTIVDKTREIYFIDNVKFHIDQVKNLGSFVEIEAIDHQGTFSLTQLTEQCHYYIDLFQIPSNALLATSYCNLLKRPF